MYKILFALTAYYNRELELIDIKTVFLYVLLTTDVYIEQPYEYKQERVCCKLL